jgi:hypothetical protein
MKIKNLILGLAAVLAVSSCSDDENYTITLKESGKLSLEVTINESPVVGEIVYLIPQFDESKDKASEVLEYSIDNKITDENGKVGYGDVNVGNYYLVMEDVEIGGKFYNPSKLVQAVSGVNKSYSINIMDYTGTIEITVQNYNYETYEYEPYSGAKVAILTDEDYNNSSDIEDRLTKTIEQETTGSSGTVSFTLPSGTSYYAIVYITDGSGDIAESYSDYLGYLSAGEEDITTFNTDF